MYSKFAKIISIAICIFIIPNSISAIDKSSLLNNLIKYSYPEIKVLDDNDDDIQQKNVKNTKQYVNVYIGEENIPTISNQDNTDINLESAVYRQNSRVTSDKPQILIYHSHSCETYSDSPEGNYHSEDKEHSVMSVGCLLTNHLSDLGWGVVHSTTYHDSPTYNNSYIRSAETIKSVMDKYDSVKVTIDLHRDGLNISNQRMISWYLTPIVRESTPDPLGRVVSEDRTLYMYMIDMIDLVTV